MSTPGEAGEVSDDMRPHTLVVGAVMSLALTAVMSALAGSVTAADVVEPLPVMVWLPVTSCVISVLALLAAGWDLTGRGAAPAVRGTAVLAALAPLAVVATADGDWTGARFVDEAGSLVWTLTAVFASTIALLLWAVVPRRPPRGSAGLGIASGAGCSLLVVVLAIAAAVPYLQKTEAVVHGHGSYGSVPADLGSAAYRMRIVHPIHAVGPGFARVNGSAVDVVDGRTGRLVWSYDLGELADEGPTVIADASYGRATTVTIGRGRLVAVLNSFSGEVLSTGWAEKPVVDNHISRSDLDDPHHRLTVLTTDETAVSTASVVNAVGTPVDSFEIPGWVSDTAQDRFGRIIVAFSQHAPVVRDTNVKRTRPVSVPRDSEGRLHDVVGVAAMDDRFLVATYRQIFTVDAADGGIARTTPSPCSATAIILDLTVVRGAVIVTCSDVATGRSEVVGMR